MASDATVPETRASPVKPNMPLNNNKPSVKASYRPLTSRSIDPDGAVPAKNSSRAPTPSLS